MSREVSILDKKLPAHLKVLASDKDDVMDEWGSGTKSGFPVISINGKVFHIKRGTDLELVTRPDDPDEAATRLQVIVLRSNRGVARTYYEDKYVEGSDDPPTCYSNDGVAPEPDVEDRQAKKCAICKHAQWGSRITENGKKGKACSEVKRLAVVPAGQLNDPMLLRIPPTSLKEWDLYVESLAKRGLNPTQMITSVGFDPKVSHQLFVFKPVGFVTEDMVPELRKTLEDNILDTIVGSPTVPAETAEDDEEEDEPAPKAKAKAKHKPAPVEEDEEDEEEDEPAPAPKPKAKRKPAAKAKPTPVEDDEDEEDEEDAPPPKRKPKAKPAPVVDEEDDEEDDEGLDGLEGLDFDDIDFGDDED